MALFIAIHEHLENERFAQHLEATGLHTSVLFVKMYSRQRFFRSASLILDAHSSTWHTSRETRQSPHATDSRAREREAPDKYLSALAIRYARTRGAGYTRVYTTRRSGHDVLRSGNIR